MKAKKDDWKNAPLSEQRKPLGYERVFSNSEAERLMQGHIPNDMDDKWFIYFEDGWVNFHRSWTGHCIFRLKLDGAPTGVRVVESWVTSDPEQFKVSDLEKSKEILAGLIDSFFLRTVGV